MDIGKIVQYDTPFNILTRPANQFVHNLVGADDTVRHLSLLRVETAMTRTSEDFRRNGEPTISAGDNLRNALSLLLRTGAHTLAVLHESATVGILTLDHIRNKASGEVIA
jgi:osmoprotectant transport system ATP-binding protein